jgi:hypothetical protein
LEGHIFTTNIMDFKQAVDKMLSEGATIRRKSWAQPAAVFRRPEGNLPFTVFMNAVSIPESIKDHVAKHCEDQGIDKTELSIVCSSHLCKLNADLSIDNSWDPCVRDMVANDWETTKL